MPKMKTRRAAKKRFRITGGGKVRFQRANTRHNLERMSGTYHRQHFTEAELAPEMAPAVKRMLARR
jgi:large subunit ribosomal protein L35